MAVNYVTLDNLGRALQRYDNIFKQYSDDKMKSYIRAISFDDQTRKLKFYTVPAPVPAGTVPYLEVEIPEDTDELVSMFTVSGEEMQVPDTGKFKTYKIYQGTGANKHEILKINLEYDTVVQSGQVVVATPANPIVIGQTTYTDGKFLELTIKNDAQKVYIALTDIGAVYSEGNGIDIDAQNHISIEIDGNNANGLAVTNSGLKLNLAVAPDVSQSIAGSAGAMSAGDKEKLDSVTVATEAQIKALFD